LTSPLRGSYKKRRAAIPAAPARGIAVIIGAAPVEDAPVADSAAELAREANELAALEADEAREDRTELADSVAEAMAEPAESVAEAIAEPADSVADDRAEPADSVTEARTDPAESVAEAMAEATELVRVTKPVVWSWVWPSETRVLTSGEVVTAPPPPRMPETEERSDSAPDTVARADVNGAKAPLPETLAVWRYWVQKAAP